MKLWRLDGSFRFRWYPPKEIRVSSPARERRIKVENAEELSREVESLLKSPHIMGTSCKVKREGDWVWADCGALHIEFYGREPQVVVEKEGLGVATPVEEIVGGEDNLTFRGSTFNIRVIPSLNKVEIAGKETLNGFAIIKGAYMREEEQ